MRQYRIRGGGGGVVYSAGKADKRIFFLNLVFNEAKNIIHLRSYIVIDKSIQYSMYPEHKSVLKNKGLTGLFTKFFKSIKKFSILYNLPVRL